jgi:putative protease
MCVQKRVELLAPAGNLEKLKMAIIYGADAVYIGGKSFSLRTSSDNFTCEEMKEGIRFVHERGKKIYLTLNAIPHNDDIDGLMEYIREIRYIGLDAVIVSDPGVFSLVKDEAPEMEIHISTQANNTNYKSVDFWNKLGAKRVVLARELSLAEIRDIKDKCHNSVEIECFVHGAMCMSYSGRCMLSTYMTGRNSNKGQCAHPCRWKYHVVEEKRPGEYLPVYEDENGTYIFNSKDLCMIEYLPELINSGIESLKIEGRSKSAYYVATVVRAYKMALDKYYEEPSEYVFDEKFLIEVSKASHREFTTGFYLNKPDGTDRIYDTSSYVRSYDFVGLVLEYDETTKIAKVEQRNRMYKGEKIEVVVPGKEHFNQEIMYMKDCNQKEIDVAPHAQMILYMPMEKDVLPNTILRRMEAL